MLHYLCYTNNKNKAKGMMITENALDEKTKNNIISCKKAISLARQIQEHLNNDILKEGQPIIIMNQYEWLREVLSLLSKQSNLFESCVLLLENNMEQEAYILARSQFNNMLWISYLCKDNKNERVKEYFYEEHIDKLQQLYNLKKYINNLPTDTVYLNEFPNLNQELINSKINEIKNVLKSEGYVVDAPNKPLRNKRIIDLTEWDTMLLGLYDTFYNEASKYEHSNISTTKSHRQPIVDDISVDVAFVFDLSKSDIRLWKSVFGNSLTILFLSVNSILTRLQNKDKHLFDFEQFNEVDFSSVILNIKTTRDILDTIVI